MSLVSSALQGLMPALQTLIYPPVSKIMTIKSILKEPSVILYNRDYRNSITSGAVMRAGITGTRHGWNDSQRSAFEWWLKEQDITEWHHGDCDGVDEQSSIIVRDKFGWDIIDCHPPDKDLYRAHFGGAIIHQPKPYIQRNHDIVNAIDLLVAVPLQAKEVMRGSGTWATIRYAIKKGVIVRRIDPQGHIC